MYKRVCNIQYRSVSIPEKYNVLIASDRDKLIMALSKTAVVVGVGPGALCCDR